MCKELAEYLEEGRIEGLEAGHIKVVKRDWKLAVKLVRRKLNGELCRNWQQEE